MARARKPAAPAAVAQTATDGAPANAGAPVPTIAGDPGNDPAQAAQTVNDPNADAGHAFLVQSDDKPETKPLDGMISVRSHRPRRRAGLAFGPEAVTIDTAELTDEQLEAITGDPLLEVTEAE